MAKFHVGQRVRIVQSKRGLVGHCGTIDTPLRPVTGCDTGEISTRHRVVIDGIDSMREYGAHLNYLPQQLEPIRDDTQLSTWEQVHAICGFKPASVRA